MDDFDPVKVEASAREASCLLKALANQHRLMILCQLVGRERSVGELVRAVGLSQSALSQHLARLRRDGLVRTRREAQTIWYSIAAPEVNALLERLYEIYCAPGASPRPSPSAARSEALAAEPEVCG